MTPTSEELLSLRLKDSPVTLEELERYPSGNVYPNQIVQQAREHETSRFDVMPADVAQELSDCKKRSSVNDKSVSGLKFTHILSSRRLRDVFNSTGIQLSSVLKRTPYNPAYLNSSELVSLGVKPGDQVEISSEHGSILAIVQPDEKVRDQVVSIAHAWGGLPNEEGQPGVNVNELIDCHKHYESINAMPWMSGFPVTIRKTTAN